MDVGSVNSLHDLQTPLPTPPEEKKAVTLKRLSYVFGFLYSLFLVIIGTSVSTYSVHSNDNLWSPLLNIYIISSGLIILCTLIIDVKLFTRKIRKQVETIGHKEELFELGRLKQLNTNTGDETTSRDSDDHALAAEFIPHDQKLEHIHHKYCFSRGRHAGSVYLKFGAAVFALGQFVHTILVVVVLQISIIMHSNSDCINAMQYAAEVLEAIYCFVQLYFIFNYSNLIIINYTTLARVAFLHIISGNICLWISAVTTETQLALKAYVWAQIKKNTTNTTVQIDEKCIPDINVSRILDNYSAYLYPFTVEFNFLTVGIFFMIWTSIGKCYHSTEEAREFQHSLYAHSNVSGDVNSPHHLDIHISCRNAMGGLFSSLFAIVVLIVAIILGFVFGTMGDEFPQFQMPSSYDGSFSCSFIGVLLMFITFVFFLYLEQIGDTIGDSMYLLFHKTMLVATIWAFYKTYSLDINKHPVPWLDDVLLYICVPAFFLETLLTVVALIYIPNVVKIIDTVIMSLQMVIQTAFIIDGLRRCSNSRRLRRRKPGRELVLFLLVSNVCMWFMYSFSYKPAESLDERYVFYGKTVWLAVGHLCTPIIMFYRFHSSVCIADIWSYAYNPGIENH